MPSTISYVTKHDSRFAAMRIAGKTIGCMSNNIFIRRLYCGQEGPEISHPPVRQRTADMTHDDGLELSLLIEGHWLARETYYLRKRQELSSGKDHAAATTKRRLTNSADHAWKDAEAALWHYSATHGTMARPTRPPNSVRALFTRWRGGLPS